jgi:hypothetical protein
MIARLSEPRRPWDGGAAGLGWLRGGKRLNKVRFVISSTGSLGGKERNANGAKRNGSQVIENNQFREIGDPAPIIISMRYRQQCEIVPFAFRNGPFLHPNDLNG